MVKKINQIPASPIKLLVVDDEADMELLVKNKFRKQIQDKKYILEFAQNGEEAFNKIVKYTDINIILSDINMPIMDGFTLLQKIKKLDNQLIKTIIVTAYGDMENIRKAMNYGAFDFVMKPIDFTDLQLTIDRTFGELLLIQDSLRIQKELTAVEHELNLAAQIQNKILPRNFPPFPERNQFDLYARMVPAKKIGGDFYDFFMLDENKLGLVIGDVEGKGIPAAIFMAMCRTLLKVTACQVANPAECLNKLNRLLLPESENSKFVTVFYGILDIPSGEFHYSNGGHCFPYLLRANGSYEQLGKEGGLLLGLLDSVEYNIEKNNLNPGDSIFLYTDGVTEARDNHNAFYGDLRLTDCLKNINGSSPEQVTECILDHLKSFTDGMPQGDDITMMVLRYNGFGK